MSQPFTHKYIPKRSSDIIGQETAVKQAKDFLATYPKEKALLLYGPPGIGKTSLAQALANETGAELFEINASDTRNKESLNTVLGSAIKQRSFFSDKKVILVDEIDGLSGSDDRGGIPELARLIEETKFPMILTCRDPYADNLKPIKKVAKAVELTALTSSSISQILSTICQKEQITCAADVIQALARKAEGDARAAINDLQVLAAGKNVISKDDLDILTTRSKIRSIEEALTTVFKSQDAKTAIGAFDEVEEDIDQQFLWLDYNLPQEYTQPDDLARAYGALSKADIYRKRIMRRQHWRFLVYVNALLTAGIATAKDEPYKTAPSYKQTTRLLRIWQINMSQSKKKAIAQKIARYTHTSTRRVIKDFGLYQQLFQKDKQFAQHFAQEADLDEEEIAWMKKVA